MAKKPFVILDRDGTIIEERHYLSDPDQVKLCPGAADGLRKMRKMGLGIVIVTNQAAIGRGLFGRERLELIHQRLGEFLESEGISLDGIYHCPHTPEDNCPCRKPEPGMIEQAARDLGFEPQDSFVIGDKPCDIDLGKRVGATTILVRTGYGREVASEKAADPDYTVDNLSEAAECIRKILPPSPLREEEPSPHP